MEQKTIVCFCSHCLKIRQQQARLEEFYKKKQIEDKSIRQQGSLFY